MLPLLQFCKVKSAVHCRSLGGFKDELAWGAMWLHKATGEQAYLDKAEEFLNTKIAWALSWGNKNVGAQVDTTEAFIIHLCKTFIFVMILSTRCYK